MDALQIQKGSVPNAQVPCCRYDYLMRRVMVWWVRKWKGKLWRGGCMRGFFFNQAKCYRGALNETYLLSVSALHLGESSSNDLVNFTTWKMQKGRNHNSSWTYKVFTGKKGENRKQKNKNAHAQMHWHIWQDSREKNSTGDSMSSSNWTEQRSHLSSVCARCMIFLTIFSRSVCSSNRSLTTSRSA